MRNTDMLKDIKKDFYAFRNGIIADTLRKAGMPYKVIFGLQIPQIAEIARRQEPEMALADELWRDREVRESRLLATYIFPSGEITEEKAMELVKDIRTPEESDMLSFRLLKRLPYAPALLAKIEADPTLPAYIASSLRNHIS